MNPFKISQIFRTNKKIQQLGTTVIPLFALLAIATPASAHHMMGGKMPANFFEGFITGIAHPLIGPDHFAFIVAIGLLAATKKQGILIPIAFVLAAMAGTGLHLARLAVPGVELFVSGSIIVFGILLAQKNNLNTAQVGALSVIAGLFHGYAYGEPIFGAEMTPLFAYLAGFTVIQLAVALTAFWIGKATVLGRNSENQPSSNPFRSAGWVICGAGLAFFASQVVSLVFSLPNT